MCISAKQPRVPATIWYEPHANDFRRQGFLRAQRLIFQAVEQRRIAKRRLEAQRIREKRRLELQRIMEKRRLEAMNRRKASFKARMVQLIDEIIINNEEMSFFPNEFEAQFYWFLNWNEEFRHYNGF